MTDRAMNWAIRLGLVCVSAATLAACGTTSPYSGAGQVENKGPNPTFPVRANAGAANSPNTQVIATGPAAPASAASSADDPNPPAPVPGAAPPPAPDARPAGVVASQPLAPLVPQADPNPPAPQPSVPAPAPQVAQPAPPPPPPVAPPPAPIFREIAAGPVIETDGPPATRTARAMDTTVKDLQTRNKLGNSTNIRPGQRMRGPSTKVKAYVVQQGDTLAAIGRRFTVTTAQLTRANSLPASGAIRPGQRVILPSGYRDTGPQRIEVNASGAPVATSIAALTPAPARGAAPPPPVIAAPPAARPPVVAALPQPTSALALSQGRGQFIWPVDGRTIGNFGPRGPGQSSDGIDIAAADGADVRAAANGTVKFAGRLEDSLDLGTIVLIENAQGFFSIYGHLASATVRPDQRVTQGQIIGRVGSTGVVSEPELYFELRHQDTPRDALKPVDPLDILPRR